MNVQGLSETLALIRDGGSTLLLVVAILGGFKGWYVWRWQYDERKAAHAEELSKAEHERDDWKSVALRGLNVAERVTG